MQGRPKLHLEYMLGRSIVDQLCKYVPTLVILYQTNSIKNMHCYCSLVLKFALCLILASVTVRVGPTETHLQVAGWSSRRRPSGLGSAWTMTRLYNCPFSLYLYLRGLARSGASVSAVSLREVILISLNRDQDLIPFVKDVKPGSVVNLL
jgi:hypothetical protein